MDSDDDKNNHNPLPPRKGRLAPLSIPPPQQRNEIDIVNSTNDPINNNNNDETNTNEKQTENEQNNIRKPTLSSVSNSEKDLQLEEERRKLRSQRFSNRRTKKAAESTESPDANNTRESPRTYITPRSNTNTNTNQNSTPRRPNNLPSLPPTNNENTPNQNNESNENNENNISSENMAQMSGLGRLSARRTRMKKPSETNPETERSEKSENESDNQPNRQEKNLNNDINFNNNNNNANITLPNSQNSPQVNEEMRKNTLINTTQSEMISSNGIPYPTLPSPHVNTFSNPRLQPSKRNEILFVESSDGKFKKMSKSTADRRNVAFELDDDLANTNKWDAYIDSREGFLSSLFMLVQGFMAGFSILQVYICYIGPPPGNSLLSFLSSYSYVSSMIQHTYFLFSTLCLLSALNKFANDKRFNTPITPFNSQTTLIQIVPYRTIVVDIIIIVCYSIVFFSCIIIARTEDLFYYTQLSSPNWFNLNPVLYKISKSQINTFHAFNILRIAGSVIAWVLIVKESKTKNTQHINPLFSPNTSTATQSPLIQSNTINNNNTTRQGNV